jgi:hypothetical protein
MRPDANTNWFNFTAQSGDFGVYNFSGMEQVSLPYEFSVELVSRSTGVIWPGFWVHRRFCPSWTGAGANAWCTG